MTRHNLSFGSLLKIPIGLDYSWLLIFALLTWLLAKSYSLAEFKNWSSLLCWLIGAVTSAFLGWFLDNARPGPGSDVSGVAGWAHGGAG